jgi:hypothetical protein
MPSTPSGAQGIARAIEHDANFGASCLRQRARRRLAEPSISYPALVFNRLQFVVGKAGLSVNQVVNRLAPKIFSPILGLDRHRPMTKKLRFSLSSLSLWSDGGNRVFADAILCVVRDDDCNRCLVSPIN